ncbi:MAG: Dabb family protein [Pseudomonadota bacterium]
MNTSPILRHLVLCSFIDTTTERQLAHIIEDFTRLKQGIPQIHLFEHGANNSPEGLSQGFSYCFNLGFLDQTGRDAYLVHPLHLAFVERFKPWLAKVLVLDYWATVG